MTTTVALAIIAVGGFWLGAFSWFGGHIWVKQVFFWAAFSIGFIVTAFRWRAFPRRWPLHVAFFISSQLLFSITVAAGQVLYASPGSAGEAIDLFGIALRGGL